MDMESLFKLPYLVVGAIGGSLSVLFGENKPKTVTEFGKVSLFVMAGAVLTNFLTPLVFYLVPTTVDFEHPIAFVVGLLGIGVVKAVLKVITMLNSDFFGTVKKVKEIFWRN